MDLRTRYGGSDAKISALPSKRFGFLDSIWDKITGQDTNQQLENEAFLALALGGDKYASRDPRAHAGIKMAGDPKGRLGADWLEKLKLTPNPNSRVVYSGGPNKTFWSENQGRAASYMDDLDDLSAVYNVPDEVFEYGNKTANKLGQPTRFDTVLPNEYVKRAVPVKGVKPKIFEATDEIDDLDSFLRSMKF